MYKLSLWAFVWQYHSLVSIRFNKQHLQCYCWCWSSWGHVSVSEWPTHLCHLYYSVWYWSNICESIKQWLIHCHQCQQPDSSMHSVHHYRLTLSTIMLCPPREYVCRALFIQVWGTIYKLFMVEAYALSFTTKEICKDTLNYVILQFNSNHEMTSVHVSVY